VLRARTRFSHLGSELLHPATLCGVTRASCRLSVALRAERRAQVDAFHAAAIEAGGTDNGAPGLRAVYHPDYYGGYILDPDGNNIEAVCHQPG
jgi:predicted lactoylglutathione lyase